MSYIRPFLFYFVLAAGHVALASETLTEISMDDLPKPPGEVGDLIDRANVSFRFGPRSLLGRDELDRVSNRRRRLAAETQFEMKYTYATKTRWRIERQRQQRQLVVNVSYQTLDLNYSHDVWFRDEPSVTEFWDERLVGHELDHVRISSDPIIEKRFQDLVRQKNEFTHPIDQDTDVTKEMVRELVEDHVRGVFDQIISLVRIRYEELDRVTDHGLRPIPPDAKASQWTRPAGKSAP
tara:strand:+ start:45822 stop:46532 length:711 start_codon:yes stop_codon:yes gene_type:complete